MFSNTKTKIKELSSYNFFATLIVVNVVFIFLGLIFYNGNFNFWSYPFSYLSDVKTVDGIQNNISSIIYSFEMFTSGMIMISLFYKFYKNNYRKKDLFILIFTFLCSSGFLIACFSPDDSRQYLHIFGSALVVASLWLIATKYLFNLKKDLKQFKYYFWQTILQFSVFSYGLTYLFRIEPLATILQKFAFLGLGLALLYATYFEKKLKNK
ncbi:MAG: hypothetical protein WC663_01405 [Patescibacteria group bacterium]|jgi:hypothetical protein